MVITTPDLAPGFRLAGVETFVAETGPEAEAVLRQLLAAGEASFIAIRHELMETLDPHLRRQLENSFYPVVMAVPGGTSAVAPGERRRYMSELIRRAIGFQITFGGERSTER